MHRLRNGNSVFRIRVRRRRLDLNSGRQQFAVEKVIFVGVCCVAFYMLVKRDPVPDFSKVGEVPWWGWIGGLCGAAYGLAAVILASQMGAATLTALVVTGQLICAVVLDNYGWVGFDVQPAGGWRIVGCGLMVAGLVLIGKF
jgi:transporter family-2 protein